MHEKKVESVDNSEEGFSVLKTVPTSKHGGGKITLRSRLPFQTPETLVVCMNSLRKKIMLTF